MTATSSIFERAVRTGIVCACLTNAAPARAPAHAPPHAPAQPRTKPVKPAAVPSAFAGQWRVTAWQVAPWVAPAERKAIKADAGVLNHTITFTPAAIAGPPVIACRGPKYESKDVPFDGLFEGGLKNPAADASALGFTAPVTTLMPGCDMEYHLLRPGVALFALDNVLYTMSRPAPTPR